MLGFFLLALSSAFAQSGEGADPLPFPDMAPAVGEVLREHYYDAKRFRPRLMVERALRTLEQTEIGLDTTWSGGNIVLNLRGTRQTVPAPEPSDLAAAMQLIEAVRLATEAGLDVPVKRRRELAYALLNGALSTLDPHTVLWPPEAAREWSEDTIQGQFYGIGAFLNQDEGLISIQRVMPGLPAERAGVEDGDVIVAIDGEKTGGLTLEQAVRRIKGPKGTTVNLSMERKGLKAPVNLPITRDLVKVVTMRSYRDGGVGYVRMDEFNANTAHDLFRALRELENQKTGVAADDGPLKALVLDLRFNGGGLLDQAKLIGGFFLARGQEIVRTTTVDGEEERFTNSARRFVTAPILVLTAAGTASAAEIVSGALQRNERAVVAGEPTFGKGSVQNIRELRDASRLKLTIQEYLLPGGVSIQDVGVMPDLLLPRHSVRQNGSVDVRDFAYERERDNEFALGERDTYKHQSSLSLGWLDPWLERDARRAHTISAREFVPDREAQLTIDLMKEASSAADWQAASTNALEAGTARAFLLERLKAPVAKRAEVESIALADALARLPQPVRWGLAAAPAAQLAITWTGPTEVVAGETVALTVQVNNPSEVEAGRLFAVIRADPRSPLWEEEFIIGAVSAKGSAAGIMHFKVPPRLSAGEERFSVDLIADGVRDPVATCDVVLRVIARPAPQLGLAWRVEMASGDLALTAGDRAELKVDIFNAGPGTADGAVLWVEKNNDSYISLELSRAKIEQPLASGASTTISVPFTVLKELKRGGEARPFTADRIKLQLNVGETFADGIDGRYRSTIQADVEIMIGQPLKPRRVQAPAISFVGSEDESGRTRLRFHITDQSDDPQAEVLRFVALFQDEDKIDMQSAGALDVPADALRTGPWTYSPRVTLKPGLNRFRLLVSDGDGVLGDRMVRLWGPPASKPNVVQAPAVLP